LLATLALWAACLGSAYLLAVRAAGDAPTSVRASAALLIAWWLLVASFLLCASLHVFRLVVVLPGWSLVFVLLLHRFRRHASERALVRSDLRRVREVLQALRRSPWRWLFYAVASLLFVYLVRGMAAPPLGWDALTYHLVKAARWVQSGGFAPEAAPDAWGYYEYFSPTGDILWAWAMLPMRGDALLAPAGIGSWLGGVVSAYALARSLGAAPLRSSLTALAVGLFPAVVHYVMSAYVDNATLTFFLCAVLFLHRAREKERAGEVLLAFAALGLLASMRPFFVPVALFGFALLVAPAWRAASLPSRRLVLLGACAVAAAIALPPYLRAWIERGSPLYPFELSVGGETWLAGNEELTLLLTGRIRPGLTFDYGAFLSALFWPSRLAVGLPHVNLGPIAPVFLLAGLAALARLLRRPATRATALFAMVAAAMIVGSCLSDGALGLRTFWVNGMGRFLAPALAVLTVFAALFRGLDVAWGLAVVVEIGLALPLGIGRADLEAMGELGLWLLAVAMALALVAFAGRRLRRPRTGAALAVALVALFAIPWQMTRDRHRAEIYRAAASGSSYDIHPLAPAFASSFALASLLDDGASHRIAVTAGWAGAGHNWYRYPFFGRRLQNEVLYVTPTRDGSIVDYRREEDLARRSSVRAWLQRLVAARVEIVAALAPEPIEARSTRELPGIFELLAESLDRRARAYRFRPEAASRWLTERAHRVGNRGWTPPQAR
jgi:4-amino-4-deoxy-L-arabinose transferase-like glycosyltransferase